MNLLDVLSAHAWAMDPGTFEQMCAVVERHAAGIKLDATEMQAAIGRAPQTPNPRDRKYEVHQGVALIPIQGVISKYSSAIGDMCYGRGNSAEQIQEDIATALADPNVTSLMFHCESPGGVVDGMFATADAIKAASAKKPTAAYIDGLGASAAYCLVCAADKVWASSTSIVGSIGVIKAIRDTSAAAEKSGVKTIVLRSGPHKGGIQDGEAATAERLAPQMAILNGVAQMFFGHVQSSRGMDQAQLAAVTDGRAWIASDAKDLGLIDAIGSMEQCLAALTDPSKRSVKPILPMVGGTHSSSSKATAQAGATSTTPAGVWPAAQKATMQIDPKRLNDLTKKHTAHAPMIVAMATGADDKTPATEADILAAIQSKDHENTRAQLEDMTKQLAASQEAASTLRTSSQAALAARDTEITSLKAVLAEKETELGNLKKGNKALESAAIKQPENVGGSALDAFNAKVEEYRAKGDKQPYGTVCDKHPDLRIAMLEETNGVKLNGGAK